MRLQADTLNEERRVAHEEEKDRYQKANGELKQELEDFIMREGKYEKRSCPWAPHYLIDSSVPTPEDLVIQIHPLFLGSFLTRLFPGVGARGP